MAKVPETIGNGKRLDRLIDDTLAEMAAKGITTRNVRKSVGGSPPGLMIQITPTGSASWILRTTYAGKRREYGLGSYRRKDGRSGETPQVSLSKARSEAEKIVDAMGEGSDPVATRRAAKDHRTTFREAAKAYIAKERSGWRNDKHAGQWESTLERWVYPKIGDTPVEAVDLDAVEGVLIQPVKGASNAPLWTARHVTARRVRQRIEHVLDYATAKKQRGLDNPARVTGPLAKLLPKISKAAKKPKNHASLPYVDAPAFMADLRSRAGVAAQALQFLIYTAARSGEVRHATWDEIDLDARLWRIPADKMKAEEPHDVPLSGAAIAILTRIPEHKRKPDEYVFPSAKRDDETGRFKAMSDMTLAAVLKRMKHTDITVHGFRSTFRTWAEDQTTYSREVKESALAHTIGESDTERAYLRTKYLPPRTKLMDDWAAYLSAPSIVSIEAE